ncbi:NAD(P)/FAD-dependent oxidoreductase [Spirochaeta africana]|nr:FAD-dependent oxidoreductase [Spirochaeta africana]
MKQHLLHTRLLIIGQGIAGSMLAYALWRRGLTRPEDFMVIDAGDTHAATRVSTGVINPFGFARLNYSAVAPEVGAAWEHYNRLERMLQHHLGTHTRYAFAHPLLRLFTSPMEAGRWQERYRLPVLPHGSRRHNICLTQGGGVVPNSGWIEAARLVRDIRRLLQQRQQYIHADIPASTLMTSLRQASGNIAELHSIRYSALILCSGVQHALATGNSLPDARLPYYPVGGEVMSLYLPAWPVELAVSRGITIQPSRTHSGWIRVGATYQRTPDTDLPNAEGIAWLRNQFDQLCIRMRSGMPDSTGRMYQQAVASAVFTSGIRPAAIDRQPYLGQMRQPLPQCPPVYIMNGLGSRGIARAPVLAETLANHILQKAPIPPAWQVQRVPLDQSSQTWECSASAD